MKNKKKIFTIILIILCVGLGIACFYAKVKMNDKIKNSGINAKAASVILDISEEQ